MEPWNNSNIFMGHLYFEEINIEKSRVVVGTA